MVPVEWPCLLCLSEQCRQQQTRIPLPFSFAQQLVVDPARWPTDYNPLYVACPECRRVSSHSHWVPFLYDQEQPHFDNVWLRISFRCAVEGCNTPIQFHVLVEPPVTETTKRELREQLANGYWTGVFPCGHSIAITTDQKLRFDRVGAAGHLEGYEPHHPMWLDF